MVGLAGDRADDLGDLRHATAHVLHAVADALEGRDRALDRVDALTARPVLAATTAMTRSVSPCISAISVEIAKRRLMIAIRN